jgi:hypothetical protein
MYFTKFIDSKNKLYLCSSDIGIGDNVIDVYGKEFVVSVIRKSLDGRVMVGDEETIIFLESVFKLISQISREATWVKEGDIFREDELLQQGFGVNITPSPNGFMRIKGPCGHFH